MPTVGLEGDVRIGWSQVKNTIQTGIEFEIKPNGTISNNLLGRHDNRIIHVRLHAAKAAYKLDCSITKGNVERDANPLPDGQWMTT